MMVQGLDAAAVAQQLQDYPFGEFAARMAVFRAEIAPSEARSVFRMIAFHVRNLIKGSAQQDLVLPLTPEEEAHNARVIAAAGGDKGP